MLAGDFGGSQMTLCKQEVTGSIPVGSMPKALQIRSFSDLRQRAV
jgi:hypothetical protein